MRAAAQSAASLALARLPAAERAGSRRPPPHRAVGYVEYSSRHPPKRFCGRRDLARRTRRLASAGMIKAFSGLSKPAEARSERSRRPTPIGRRANLPLPPASRWCPTVPKKVAPADKCNRARPVRQAGLLGGVEGVRWRGSNPVRGLEGVDVLLRIFRDSGTASGSRQARVGQPFRPMSGWKA
jgi:hypothetical protein